MRKQPLWKSFQYAFAGIGHVLLGERNFKIELAVALVVVLLGLFLRVSPGDWAVLVLTISIVLAAEVVNTSIEALVDLLSPKHQSKAKIAKDAAAGAVLLAAIAAVVVGLLILGPPLYAKFFN